MSELLAPFRELLLLMVLIPFAVPAAMLLRRACDRLAARALVREQLRIAADLGVDELALAACDTHVQQLELIEEKLREHEFLQRMRPRAERAAMLAAYRRWVDEWSGYARRA